MKTRRIRQRRRRTMKKTNTFFLKRSSRQKWIGSGHDEEKTADQTTEHTNTLQTTDEMDPIDEMNFTHKTISMWVNDKKFTAQPDSKTRDWTLTIYNDDARSMFLIMHKPYTVVDHFNEPYTVSYDDKKQIVKITFENIKASYKLKFDTLEEYNAFKNFKG